MTTLPFGRQLIAVTAALLVGSACIVGAVGPAAVRQGPVVTASRA